ncbi:MAG: pyridoxal phosphate-dependent aminotransferase [Planctomycetes bacterium]|nr:pyridoxal phosphate-dependent aminotransferase [Planctomycetota bacterium]
MGLAGRVAHLEESATLAVGERAAKMKASGIDVVSFGAGEPDFDTPEHIKKAAVDALAKGATKYTASSGIAPLRRAVAQKFERDNGLSYSVEQVLISCGSKHSIYNALQALVDPNDRVIIPAPYWVSYPEMVKCAGGEPVIVQTDEKAGFKMRPEQLKRALARRAKAFILCSPSNPTGIVYSPDELKALARVIEETDVWVISDEIYEHLIYGGARHVSIATFDGMKDRTLVVNGISKAFAMTGWRIGYMAGPREVVEAAAKIQSHSTSNPTTVSQHAALAALEGGLAATQAMAAEYVKRRDVIVRRLRAVPGVTCVQPEGAFYAFPNVSDLYNGSVRGSGAFATALLEEVHVAVVPGEPFGSDAHVRLSYATSMDRIAAGMDRLETFAKKLRG